MTLAATDEAGSHFDVEWGLVVLVAAAVLVYIHVMRKCSQKPCA